MSGAIAAALSAPSIERLSGTLTDFGSQLVAFNSAVTMRGATLVYIDLVYSSSTLRIQMQPILSQSFFRRIDIETANPGIFQQLDSSTATYSEIGGTNSQWLWQPETPWSVADAGEVKRIIFSF